jgi:hypothetical protein
MRNRTKSDTLLLQTQGRLPSALDQGTPSAELPTPFPPRSPSAFFFLTPVWGASYTSLYIDTVIPAQLAGANLPACRDRTGSRYIIYTTPEDANAIRSSHIFEALDACVPVTFEFITKKINVVHDMMTDCYRRGIKAAEAVDAAILFLTPDIVLSDGALTTLMRLSDSGYDVVYVPAIRTLKNAVATNLAQSFRCGPIAVLPRQLMRIALDNLHPLGDSSWWEEGEGGLIPANIYWRVGNEGLVGRCFHLHPILVHPQRKKATFFGTIDDDFVPAACPDSTRDYIVTDSDQLLAIELSDPGRFFDLRTAKGSVSDTVRWAEQFTNARHRSLFKATIRMHAGVSQLSDWAAAQERARAVAEAIESCLAWPAWRLMLDPDLLIRRLIYRGKGYRLQFANQDNQSDAETALWRRAVLWIVERLSAARTGLIKLMRRIAGRIEALAARSYEAEVYRDLVSMLPHSSDPVLVTSSPGRFHLAASLTEACPSFSSDRHLTVLCHGRVIFLEKGCQIPSSSKKTVILELDAYRTREASSYLNECYRILGEQGQLIVYWHLLSFVSGSGHRSNIDLCEPSKLLASGFCVTATRQQGRLGSHLRVRLSGWLRAVINKRLAVRWLLLVLGLPLLPLIILLGCIVIASTAVLDFFDRSKRFRISTLVLACKSSHSVPADFTP